MAEIIKAMPPAHHCYHELNAAAGRYPGLGTMVRCSCGRTYRLEAGDFFTGALDSLSGRGHVTSSRGLWDRWAEVRSA